MSSQRGDNFQTFFFQKTQELGLHGVFWLVRNLISCTAPCDTVVHILRGWLWRPVYLFRSCPSVSDLSSVSTSYMSFSSSLRLYPVLNKGLSHLMGEIISCVKKKNTSHTHNVWDWCHFQHEVWASASWCDVLEINNTAVLITSMSSSRCGLIETHAQLSHQTWVSKWFNRKLSSRAHTGTDVWGCLWLSIKSSLRVKQLLIKSWLNSHVTLFTAVKAHVCGCFQFTLPSWLTGSCHRGVKLKTNILKQEQTRFGF